MKDSMFYLLISYACILTSFLVNDLVLSFILFIISFIHLLIFYAFSRFEQRLKDRRFELESLERQLESERHKTIIIKLETIIDTLTNENNINLDTVTTKIMRRECLFCKTNLDDDIGRGKWNIPLCKKHRKKSLDKIFKNETKKIN